MALVSRNACSDSHLTTISAERKVDHPSQARNEEEDLLETLSRKSGESSTGTTASGADIVEVQRDLLDTVQTDHSTENPTRSPEFQYSIIKNEFDYGGFIEYPQPQTPVDAPHRTSSFCE